MSDINFPTNPANNDTYSFQSKTWEYNGVGWILKQSSITASDVSSALGYVPVQKPNGSNGEIQFNNSNTFYSVATFVYSNGNVGIGNSAPAHRLRVEGSISDSIGDVRTLILNSKTSSYVLASSDNGKLVRITTGGVTVPASIFTAGQSITIYNNSDSSQTIGATSVTCYLAGTLTTGDRTLAGRGLATLVCVDTDSFVISGDGLT